MNSNKMAPTVPNAPKFKTERYTKEQKDRAVELLRSGKSCREVAKQISPHCSTANPVRWLREAKRHELREAARATFATGQEGNGA